MMIAIAVTTFWPAVLVATAFGGLGAVIGRSLVKSQRVVRSVEREIGIYDRAHEIYSTVVATAGPGGVVHKVSDDLVMVAALHACGAIDDHQYAEAKGRIITA
jgi:hypothetical protein